MNFNQHYNLRGEHAYLSASNYHWINYDENKLIQTYKNYLMTQRGTELHELAEKLIKLGVPLPRNKKTLNRYVNDAIGYRMTVEQPLVYSDTCFGTADAISFEKNFLRIHDLKTGVNPASIKQLFVYAALFCLEYDYKPSEIEIELRIYQNDDVLIYNPAVEEIVPIMDKIVTFTKLIEQVKKEEI